MKYIFSPEGDQALRQILGQRPMFAFDYDGTLAPITLQYAQTRTPPAIIAQLSELAQKAKVVIVTGRAVSDVAPRLGFAPHAIIGNHGAERPGSATAESHPPLVSGWRDAIEKNYAKDFHAAGVQLEDKAYSLTIHYRQAHDPHAAQDLILQACAKLTPPPRIFGGKCVVNIAPHGAPDKADALLELAKAEDADSAIFVGDDQNDEVVFRRAPAHWLGVRVGADRHSSAAYYLEAQEEMVRFLENILDHLRHDRY